MTLALLSSSEAVSSEGSQSKASLGPFKTNAQVFTVEPMLNLGVSKERLADIC